MSTRIVSCARCGQRNRVPAAAAGKPVCGKCREAVAWIVDADDATFGAVAERSSTPVLVDLWAPWCRPCRTVGPALERVAGDLAGTVKLVKVNIDNSPRLSRRFDVRAVPTLMILKDGKVVARQTGAASAATLRSWVERSLAPPAKRS
ncbi:thioredoxin [Dactylosporangium sp. NPDC051484]|uniref:thioredoxin n=1 Tax=Dactylosporangium sp. NPDC051484 TaxID=3154942 RepID=UPI00344E17DF